MTALAHEAVGAEGAPALLMGGSLGTAMAAAIPGARHEIVGPAAHVASLEQSERVNELIGEHLS